MPVFQPIEDADYEEFNNLHIRRNHIWSDVLRSLSKASFNPLVPIHVTFIGEAEIDEGGPRREFFSLALSKMAEDSTIFHGPTSARSFVRNVDGIRKRKFFRAGMFVALSLANGGPGFDCSETVYSYLCYGLCSGKIVSKVDDIADDLIKEHLLKVCDYIMTMCIGNINRKAREPSPLLNFKTLHKNSIFAMENHFSLPRWPLNF